MENYLFFFSIVLLFHWMWATILSALTKVMFFTKDKNAFKSLVAAGFLWAAIGTAFSFALLAIVGFHSVVMYVIVFLPPLFFTIVGLIIKALRLRGRIH